MADKTENKAIGQLGEDIAEKYLKKQGFSILDRNYWKKWGEIDIVGENKGKIHFVEVKAVRVEGLSIVGPIEGNNGETVACPAKLLPKSEVGYRPEENVHPKKLERMRRVIQTYILEKGIEDREWQFDVITVQIDMRSRKARVRVLGDLVL